MINVRLLSFYRCASGSGAPILTAMPRRASRVLPVWPAITLALIKPPMQQRRAMFLYMLSMTRHRTKLRFLCCRRTPLLEQRATVQTRLLNVLFLSDFLIALPRAPPSALSWAILKFSFAFFAKGYRASGQVPTSPGAIPLPFVLGSSRSGNAVCSATNTHERYWLDSGAESRHFSRYPPIVTHLTTQSPLFRLRGLA